MSRYIDMSIHVQTRSKSVAIRHRDYPWRVSYCGENRSRFGGCNRSRQVYSVGVMNSALLMKIGKYLCVSSHNRCNAILITAV
jgi:hypothetical protein